MHGAPAGFDWDGGNREKCQKHGMSIVEIESVFAGTPRVAADPAHSLAETRLIAVGRTRSGRAAFVWTRERRRNADPAGERPLHAPKEGRTL